jgi:hypothetical protein
VTRLRYAAVGLGLIAALAGCSSFDNDWQAAQGFAAGIEGRWEGTWSSDANGHEGGLRCLVTRRSDEGFDARYHATYSGFCGTVSFEYTVPIKVRSGPDGWHLQGQADLGWLAGGVYEYDGLATPERFFCNYEASEDHGIFTLRRPR